MKQLLINIEPQNQCSCFLLDMMKPLELTGVRGLALRTEYYLKPFIKAISVIMELGHAEHTGDWDPYIEFRVFNQDGSLIEVQTEPGYHNVTIQGDYLIIEDQDTNWKIFINDLEYISLER